MMLGYMLAATLSRPERVVIWLNLVLASLTIVVQVMGAVASPQPWRTVRAFTAALAIVYAVGYVWVLATDDVITWSSTMRGVGPLTWPIVWILPALVDRSVIKGFQHASAWMHAIGKEPDQ